MIKKTNQNSSKNTKKSIVENLNISKSILEYEDEPKRSNSVRYDSDDKIIIDLQTKIVRYETPNPDIFQVAVNE
jgi:hypothetical protein